MLVNVFVELTSMNWCFACEFIDHRQNGACSSKLQDIMTQAAAYPYREEADDQPVEAQAQANVGSSEAAAYQQWGRVTGETRAVGVQLVQSGLICPGAGAQTLFCSLVHRPHQPPDGCFHFSMLS